MDELKVMLQEKVTALYIFSKMEIRRNLNAFIHVYFKIVPNVWTLAVEDTIML